MSGPFLSVWDATYESLPPDNEDVSQGAGRIRDLKVDIRERLQVDHSLSGDASDGYHIQVSLLQNSSDPSLPAPASGIGSILYAKLVSSHLELFFKDDQSRVSQLTSGGFIYGPVPAGTKMLFMQASAPTGWTQDTSVNDRVLRMVNDGSGGGIGGSWTLSGLSTANHSLTIAEMPAHTHGVKTKALSAVAGADTIADNAGSISGIATDSTGSGSGHNHGNVVSDSTWRPQYVNILVASKN